MQITCIILQTDNTPAHHQSIFFQDTSSPQHATKSDKALKADGNNTKIKKNNISISILTAIFQSNLV